MTFVLCVFTSVIYFKNAGAYYVHHLKSQLFLHFTHRDVNFYTYVISVLFQILGH